MHAEKRTNEKHKKRLIMHACYYQTGSTKHFHMEVFLSDTSVGVVDYNDQMYNFQN